MNNPYKNCILKQKARGGPVSWSWIYCTALGGWSPLVVNISWIYCAWLGEWVGGWSTCAALSGGGQLVVDLLCMAGWVGGWSTCKPLGWGGCSTCAALGRESTGHGSIVHSWLGGWSTCAVLCRGSMVLDPLCSTDWVVAFQFVGHQWYFYTPSRGGQDPAVGRRRPPPSVFSVFYWFFNVF